MRTRLVTAGCVLGVVLLASGCLGFLAGDEPRAGHALVLENDWNESATFHITVERAATNETVHDETYRLDPGEEREVYNTAQASPDGIEPFAVHWTVRDDSGRVTIRTDGCTGDALVVIDAEGTPSATVMVC